MTTDPSTTLTSHEGSCHCGAIRFRFTGPLSPALACNCSMCQRAGTLLVFVPSADFELLTPADVPKDYQFGKQHIHHFFCPECGIKPYAWGDDEHGDRTVAVNVRCVEGVALDDLEVHHHDGASI